MEVFKKLLQRQEESQNELNAMRLNNHWQNLQKAKEEKIRKIQHDCALSKSERQEGRGMRQFSDKPFLFFQGYHLFKMKYIASTISMCMASIWSVMFLSYLVNLKR